MTWHFWMCVALPIALGACLGVWLMTREAAAVCNPLVPSLCEP
jgi:hypothetical protein